MLKSMYFNKIWHTEHKSVFLSNSQEPRHIFLQQNKENLQMHLVQEHLSIKKFFLPLLPADTSVLCNIKNFRLKT